MVCDISLLFRNSSALPVSNVAPPFRVSTKDDGNRISEGNTIVKSIRFVLVIEHS